MSRPLHNYASQIIPEELGILERFYKKILALGIDPEKNLATYPRGTYATTFAIPDKKIVIKFFEKEPEEPDIAKLPNRSRHILQPFCHTNILGNRLMIFPMLSVNESNHSYIEKLRRELEKEGYDFDDRKAENIGLTAKGAAYVIDEDAVKIISNTNQELDFSRMNQWQEIEPFFATDFPADLTKSGWHFDELVLNNMSNPSQSLTTTKSTKLSDPQNLVHLQ